MKQNKKQSKHGTKEFEGGDVGMNDPYEKAWEAIGKALWTQSKMILWIAERTLSAKDFKEFIDKFAKRSEDNHDELLEFLSKEGR